MSMNTPPIGTPDLLTTEPTFEQRWTAWLAKGVAHDRAVRRKMAIGVPAVIAAAAVVYALLGT